MFLLVGYMNVILHIVSPQQIHLKYVYNACSLIQKTALIARVSECLSYSLLSAVSHGRAVYTCRTYEARLIFYTLGLVPGSAP